MKTFRLLAAIALMLPSLAWSDYTAYVAAVNADSPTEYYKLAEASCSDSNSLIDATGHNTTTYSGTGTNTCHVAGPISGDNAVTFNGATYGDLGADSRNNPVNTNGVGWSVEVWSNPATVATQVYIGSKDSGGQQYMLYHRSTGDFAVQFFDTSNTVIAFFTGGSYVAGQWYHVVLTTVGDGTYVTAKLYVNAVLVNTLLPASFTGTWTTAPGATSIGRRNFSSGDLYETGTLDDVAFYGAALSLSQITTHYNTMIPSGLLNQRRIFQSILDKEYRKQWRAEQNRQLRVAHRAPVFHPWSPREWFLKEAA